MTSVGVRELRQRASELLRIVATGQTIEVTDRGRPVAILAPVPSTGSLDQLRATGELEAASASLDDLPEPLELDANGLTASEVLDQLRRDER